MAHSDDDDFAKQTANFVAYDPKGDVVQPQSDDARTDDDTETTEAQDTADQQDADEPETDDADQPGERGEDDGQEADEDEAGDADEDEAGEEADNSEEDQQRPRRKSAKKRIAELTAARRDAERRAQFMEQKLAELTSRVEKLTTGERSEADDDQANLTNREEQGSVEEQAPDPAKYHYGELDPEYIRDLTRYHTKSSLREAQEQEKVRQAEAAKQQEQQQIRQKYERQVEQGVEKYDDFEEVVVKGADNGEWPLTQTTAMLMVNSKVGADVAYHLAKNPSEAAELAKKSDVEQAVHFGRLEARFSSGRDASKKPKMSKAPQPVKQPRGGGGKFKPSPSTEDFSAFEKAYSKGS